MRYKDEKLSRQTQQCKQFRMNLRKGRVPWLGDARAAGIPPLNRLFPSSKSSSSCKFSISSDRTPVDSEKCGM